MARMAEDLPGYALPLLLLAGFRRIIDDLHAELARRGHPAARPAHGFALQAIGLDGTNVTRLGERLGVTKQAAARTVDRLVELGYVERAPDPTDARMIVVRLTPRGRELLRLSGRILERLHAELAAQVGPRRMREVERALVLLAGENHLPLDMSAWLGPGG